MGLPRWCTSNRSACQCRRYKRCRFNPWVREIPLEQEMSTQPVFLPEKSHGQRSLAGYSPCSHQELHTMEQLSTHSTHTCITYSIYGVIVKFMCQLDWVKGRPDSWEDIISGCVYEVFLEETSIWVGKLNLLSVIPQPVAEGQDHELQGCGFESWSNNICLKDCNGTLSHHFIANTWWKSGSNGRSRFLGLHNHCVQ